MNLREVYKDDRRPKKNALEPGLWLVAALIGACGPILIWAPMIFASVYLALTGIVVITVLAVFVRHSFKNPDLLRSDRHSIQSKALDILAADIRAGQHVRSLFADEPVTVTQYLSGKGEDIKS
jgi:Flp pilus assembly protein TadB